MGFAILKDRSPETVIKQPDTISRLTPPPRETSKMRFWSRIAKTTRNFAFASALALIPASASPIYASDHGSHGGNHGGDHGDHGDHDDKKDHKGEDKDRDGKGEERHDEEETPTPTPVPPTTTPIPPTRTPIPPTPTSQPPERTPTAVPPPTNTPVIPVIAPPQVPPQIPQVVPTKVIIVPRKPVERLPTAGGATINVADLSAITGLGLSIAGGLTLAYSAVTERFRTHSNPVSTSAQLEKPTEYLNGSSAPNPKRIIWTPNPLNLEPESPQDPPKPIETITPPKFQINKRLLKAAVLTGSFAIGFGVGLLMSSRSR